MSEAAAIPSVLKPGSKVQRALTITREAIDIEKRTVEISWASETPYERYWGIEILDMSPSSVRLQRLNNGGALLWNHNTDIQIGVVERAWIADRVGRAIVRFGRSAKAEEVWTDVQDNVIRNVSVGYLIHRAVLEETGDEGTDTYRVIDHEPYELTFAPVPADATIGVGRSAEDDPRIKPAAIDPAPQVPSTTPTPETRTMTTPAAIEAPALNTSEVAAQAQKAEKERQRELNALADSFGDKYPKVKEIIKKALADDSTVDAARALVMNAIAAAQTTEVPHLDLSANETRRFSVMGAILAMSENNWSRAGFEKECHTEILKRLGIAEAPHHGIFIPADVQHRDLRAPRARRDLTVGTANAGGYLVGTDLKPASFIEMLRARSIGGRVGVTFMPGLVGNVAIPKQSGASTAYWLTNEATAITESQITLAQLALAPKTLGALTELSRLLQLQSTPAADMLVMSDFARVMALKIDLAMLEGDGTGGAPTGIASTAGIGSVTGTSMAYDDVVEFQTDVATGNALTPECAYVTPPAIAGLLLQRQRFSSTDTPLWQGSVLEGQMAGFLATTTTQMTAASMIFGDFSQVVIGEWGFLELALNPYSQFSAGISAIRAMQTVDVGVRQAGAFSRATSIT